MICEHCIRRLYSQNYTYTDHNYTDHNYNLKDKKPFVICQQRASLYLGDLISRFALTLRNSRVGRAYSSGSGF